MSRTQLNNLRLFVKGAVTAWVPIAVALGVSWDAQTTALVMGASTVTIDLFFRVFGVSDTTPALSDVTGNVVKQP